MRRYVWAVALRSAARHPISFALAKRNGVSPKEKRPLVRIFLIAGRTLCCTCRKQLPCPSGWHVRPRRRLPGASTARLPTTSPFAPGEGEVGACPAVGEPVSLCRGRARRGTHSTRESKKKAGKFSDELTGYGGDGEIRTLEGLLTLTRFPIVRARPTTRHLHALLEPKLFS